MSCFSRLTEPRFPVTENDIALNQTSPFKTSNQNISKTYRFAIPSPSRNRRETLPSSLHSTSPSHTSISKTRHSSPGTNTTTTKTQRYRFVPSTTSLITPNITLEALEAEKKCLLQQIETLHVSLSDRNSENEYLKQVVDRVAVESRKQNDSHDTIQRKYDLLIEERNSLITVLDATNAKAIALNGQLQAIEVISNERDQAFIEINTTRNELEQAKKQLRTKSINETVDPLCRKLYQHLRTRDDLQSLCDHIDGQIAYLEVKSKNQHLQLLDELRAARVHLPQMIQQHEHAIKMLENRIIAKNDSIVQVEREQIKHNLVSKRFRDESFDTQISVLQPLSDVNRHSKILSSPQSHLTKHPNTPVSSISINRQKVIDSSYGSDENIAPLFVL